MRTSEAFGVDIHPAARVGGHIDVASLAVQPVELGREAQGLGRIVGEQAADADRHVGQAAGRIQPRARDKPEIGSRRFADVPPRETFDWSQDPSASTS